MSRTRHSRGRVVRGCHYACPVCNTADNARRAKEMKAPKVSDFDEDVYDEAFRAEVGCYPDELYDDLSFACCAWCDGDPDWRPNVPEEDALDVFFATAGMRAPANAAVMGEP